MGVTKTTSLPYLPLDKSISSFISSIELLGIQKETSVAIQWLSKIRPFIIKNNHKHKVYIVKTPFRILLTFFLSDVYLYNFW